MTTESQPTNYVESYTLSTAARSRQMKESIPIETRAAMCKIERLDYLLNAMPGPLKRRIEERIVEFSSPEDRVKAAVSVLRTEVKLGRESDFIRACMSSLAFDDVGWLLKVQKGKLEMRRQQREKEVS